MAPSTCQCSFSGKLLFPFSSDHPFNLHDGRTHRCSAICRIVSRKPGDWLWELVGGAIAKSRSGRLQQILAVTPVSLRLLLAGLADRSSRWSANGGLSSDTAWRRSQSEELKDLERKNRPLGRRATMGWDEKNLWHESDIVLVMV